MEQVACFKVLFIAGFGPIVRDAGGNRKLFNQALGIRFKEETGGYLHTEALNGAKTFALWPLSQAAQSCFEKDSWPDEIPAPKLGWNLTSTMSRGRPRSLNRKGLTDIRAPDYAETD